MIDILSFREAIVEIVSQIPEINKTRFVVTDDQLADYLNEHKKQENTLLMCLVPTYQSFGEKDAIKMTSYFQFFILEKVDYKEMKNEDDFLQVFIRTQRVLRHFMKTMIEYQQGDCSYPFEDLKENTIVIRPVRNKAQCNGWEIQIDCENYGSYFE